MMSISKLFSDRTSAIKALVPPAILFTLPYIVFWRLWTPNDANRVFISHDITAFTLPSLTLIMDSLLKYNEIPLWKWGVYSGIPLNSEPIANLVYYPLNWFFFLGIADISHAVVFHSYLIFHISIGAITFFILARSFQLNWLIAFFGATLYCFNGGTSQFLIGSLSDLIPHAWLPLVLLCYKKYMESRSVRFALLGGLSFSLIVSANFPYSMISLGYFTLFFFVALIFIKNKREHLPEFLFWYCISMIFAFFMLACQNFPLFEVLNGVTRPSDPSFAYARDKWGGGSLSALSGFFLHGIFNPLSMNAIAGLFVVFGIWSHAGKYYSMWVFSYLVGIFVFMLAPSFILYELFYIFVPFIDKIVHPPRVSAVFMSMAGIFLAMTGMRYASRLSLFTSQPQKFFEPVLFYVLLVAAFLWSVFRPEDQAARAAFSTVFLYWFIPAIAVVFILAMFNKKRDRYVVIASIFAVFFIDTLSLTAKGLGDSLLSSKQMETDPQGLNKFKASYFFGRLDKPKLPSIIEPRLNSHNNKWSMVQGEDNIGSYSQYALLRYFQLFTAGGYRDDYATRSQGVFNEKTSIDYDLKIPLITVQKLFHTKAKPGRGVPEPSQAVDVTKGRMWLIDDFEIVNGDPLKEMASKDFDPYLKGYLLPEKQAILSGWGKTWYRFHSFMDSVITPESIENPKPHKYELKINKDLTLTDQTPNTITVRLENKIEKKMLFFSDSWFIGWNAYVDGRRVPLYVADHNFKGIIIENTSPSTMIKFIFAPPLQKVANAVSILVLFLFSFLLYKSFKDEKWLHGISRKLVKRRAP